MLAIREASPNAGVSDSQSVKTTESCSPREFNAGERVKGRKRHVVTNTGGLLVAGTVHAANVQDRDGGPDLLGAIRTAFPWLRRLFADGICGGDKLATPPGRLGRWTVQVVWRADTAKGFKVLPRRWVVKRVLAWLNRNRRRAKDLETVIATA